MNKPLYLLVGLFICIIGFSQDSTAQCSAFTPTIDVSPVDADGIYCPGDMLTLSTQTYDNYQWFFNFSNSNSGGTPWAGGTGSSILVNASEWAVVYFYVEATLDGCTEASATVVWDAWFFLSPSISSSGQSNYCTGESTVISNAFPGPSFFQWYKDGALIPGATMSSYTVTESGTYTLSAAYAECPNYWQSSGVGPTFTFTAPIVPQITLIGNTFTADSGASWQWILDGADIPGATDASYKAEAEGMYQVRVVDANGCEATSAALPFPEPPLPIELISFSAEASADCGAMIKWTVSEQSTTEYYAIETSTDGRLFEEVNTISPLQGRELKIAFTEQIEMNHSTGYYRLRLRSLEGTTTYSPVYFINNTQCQGGKNSFKFYPNPVSDILTIENVDEINAEIFIYDGNGKLMLVNKISDAKKNINIKEWAAGIYQVRLVGEGGSWTERIVKH